MYINNPRRHGQAAPMRAQGRQNAEAPCLEVVHAARVRLLRKFGCRFIACRDALDEATALSAGHRPCAECLRTRYNQFRAAWSAGNPRALESERVSAELIDHVLHADRIDADGSKRTFRAELDSLPDGVFVSLADALDQPFLIQGQSLLAWSPGGYRERRPRPAGQRVSVLTPKSTIATFRAGFVPGVHSTGRLNA